MTIAPAVVTITTLGLRRLARAAGAQREPRGSLRRPQQPATPPTPRPLIAVRDTNPLPADDDCEQGDDFALGQVRRAERRAGGRESRESARRAGEPEQAEHKRRLRTRTSPKRPPSSSSDPKRQGMRTPGCRRRSEAPHL
jgi:hypothetical protein